MSKVELKVTAACGEAEARVADGTPEFIHTYVPGVLLDIFPYNGHVLCTLDPGAVGNCDYYPHTRLDFEFSNHEDSIRLLQNLRDAIDAALALNTHMEKGEENG